MKLSFTNATQTRERGSILPLVAAGMTAILGVTALSLDVGNVLVAQGQLKNAADAAAVVGASSLANPLGGNGAVPNMLLAMENAQTALKKLQNKSNGAPVIEAVLEASAETPRVTKAGWWDPANPQSGVQDKKTSEGMIPAVQVVLQKNGDGNKVVTSLFASVLGINSFSPSVTVVAIGDYGPARANANQLFPMAIPQCIYEQLWDPLTQQPKKDNGSEFTIQIVESTYKNTYAGNAVNANGKALTGCPPVNIWTPLSSDQQNAARVIADLINVANNSTAGSLTGSPPLAVGDPLYLANGAMSSLFGKTNTPLGAFLPVVTGSISGGTTGTVVAFACVIITASEGANDKYIEFQLLPVSTQKIFGLTNSGTDGFSCQLSSSGVSSKTYITSPPVIVN
jgi:hypothetical protein